MWHDFLFNLVENFSMKRIVEFMKRNYKVILLVTALSAILWSFIPREKTEDPEKDKLLLELLTFVLEKGHYSPVEINDDFSKKVYKKYLDNIDPTKRFFIQSDIDEFSKYETSIDDMIKNKDLTFFNLAAVSFLDFFTAYTFKVVVFLKVNVFDLLEVTFLDKESFLPVE